jgi:hypothetical protein
MERVARDMAAAHGVDMCSSGRQLPYLMECNVSEVRILITELSLQY